MPPLKELESIFNTRFYKYVAPHGAFAAIQQTGQDTSQEAPSGAQSL
jgi:hypothetical protein